MTHIKIMQLVYIIWSIGQSVIYFVICLNSCLVSWLFCYLLINLNKYMSAYFRIDAVDYKTDCL